MAVNLGKPLDANQRIDAQEELSKEKIQELLLQYVIDRQPLIEGVTIWDGHVEFHFRTDAPEYSATVSAWRRPTQ